MKLTVHYNASPLLLPKTGIRQYAYRLLQQMRHHEDVAARYFYLGRWSDRLQLDAGTESPTRLWKFKNAMRDVFPATLEMQHRLRESLFRRGIENAAGSVYHELNYLPFSTSLPTVVTVHDLSVLRYPEAHPAARVRFIAKRLPKAVGSATHIITDSEYVRREMMAEFSVPAGKITAVLLAPDQGHAMVGREVAADVMRRYGLAENGYFLAVGTLEPRKNLVTAVRAFAALPDALRKSSVFVLAGMRGWENSELDKALSPLLRRGEAKVLGFVPDNVLPALYGGATAFVYPSLYEGFGLPPLEAMACGTPVITSDRASLPEVVGDAGIMVDALDVAGLRDAMKLLIETPALREQYSQLGLARSKSFSWERTAAETLAVYRSALQA